MSDELKRDYQEKLGDKFGAVVNGVSYDWANGLVRLNEYRALFGDPANIEFINTFSGPFMSDVQQLFWRDLLLHITRLTDPVKSGDKQNITVGLYLLFIHPPAHGSEVSPAVRNTLDSARIPRASKLLICGLFQRAEFWHRTGCAELSRASTWRSLCFNVKGGNVR